MADQESEKPIAVVGAGSTGASTAYHLAKMGKRVIVIDKGNVATGTTARSSALVRTHYSNKIVASMALHSLREFQINKSFGFVNSGMMILASSRHREGILANVSMLNEVGVKNEILEGSEVAKRFPELNLSDCDVFLLEPESGYADAVGTAACYANSAIELGADFRYNSQVARIEKQRLPSSSSNSANSATLILNDGTRINCSKVILCTNVWTNALLKNSGIEENQFLPLGISLHAVMVYQRPKEYQGLKPILWDYPRQKYYKPDGQSFLLAGSLDAKFENKNNTTPEALSTNVTFDEISEMSDCVSHRIPLMADGKLQTNYVGMYDVTPDQHPIIDELSDMGLENVFCCIGLSGHGYKLCPALGLINAEMVSGIEKSRLTFDRSIFELGRFASGKSVFKPRYPELATVA